MHKNRKRNLYGTPYDLKETFNWWIKHAIINIYYPIFALLFLIYIARIIPFYFFVLLTISLHGFIIIFLWREFHRLGNKVENIGYKHSSNDNKSRWDRLNKIDGVDYIIGFVGDIMKMGKFKLEFSEDVMAFFEEVSLITGNFLPLPWITLLTTVLKLSEIFIESYFLEYTSFTKIDSIIFDSVPSRRCIFLRTSLRV